MMAFSKCCICALASNARGRFSTGCVNMKAAGKTATPATTTSIVTVIQDIWESRFRISNHPAQIKATKQSPRTNVPPPAAPQAKNTPNATNPAGSAATRQVTPRMILRIRITKSHFKNEVIVNLTRQIHDATGGDVCHALFELLRNPRVIGFEDELSHPRPLFRRQSSNLLNNFLCAHVPNFPQTCALSKRQSHNRRALGAGQEPSPS